MLEIMIMLGITIMVSMMVASVLTAWAMLKFMTTDRFANWMTKWMKKYVIMVNKMTEEIMRDLDEDGTL